MSSFVTHCQKRGYAAAAGLLLILAVLFLGRALFPPAGQALGGYDLRGYYLPLYDLAREALSHGQLPLWSSTQFNGYPVFADPQMGLFYPPVYLTLLLPAHVGISWYVLFHIWLAGMGMFLFVRQQGGGWLGAILAALTFAFGGLLAGRLWAGHTIVLAVDAWTPWLLLGLAWSVRRGGVWPAIVAGLPFGLAILAGHIPSLLYVGLIWGAFALYLFLRPAATSESAASRWLVFRQLAIAGLIGLALSAVQLLPFIQFSLTSSRVAGADYQFVTDYSFPPTHLITLLIPEYFGEPLRTGYWSVPLFEELTYYAGILPILGLVLVLRRPKRDSWLYLGLIFLGLLLAFGRYGFLYKIFYDWLPPFRVVRAPGRAAFLYLVAAAVLLGQAITRWDQQRPSAELARLLRWTLAILGVAATAALAATGAVFALHHPSDTSGRLWHQMGGWSVALIFLLAGGLLLWGYLTTPAGQVERRRWLGAALIVLVVADLWLFAFKMVRLESTVIDPVWADAAAVIGATEARVLPWGLSIFAQNGASQAGVNSVFGYSALEIESHLALAGSIPDPRSTAYDVLGARYVLATTPLEQFTTGDRPLVLHQHYDQAWIYERSRSFPVARLVTAYEVIDEPGAAIARIHEPGFDPGSTAILDDRPPCELSSPAPSGGQATILSQRNGYWQIETDSDQPALLLLAETAYPGWQVTVDGQEAEALTAYTTLRAVCVPAGRHLVEWRFAPTIHLIGALFSLPALLLVGLALVRLRSQTAIADPQFVAEPTRTGRDIAS